MVPSVSTHSHVNFAAGAQLPSRLYCRSFFLVSQVIQRKPPTNRDTETAGKGNDVNFMGCSKWGRGVALLRATREAAARIDLEPTQLPQSFIVECLRCSCDHWRQIGWILARLSSTAQHGSTSLIRGKPASQPSQPETPFADTSTIFSSKWKTSQPPMIWAPTPTVSQSRAGPPARGAGSLGCKDSPKPRMILAKSWALSATC